VFFFTATWHGRHKQIQQKVLEEGIILLQCLLADLHGAGSCKACGAGAFAVLHSAHDGDGADGSRFKSSAMLVARDSGVQ
jgi:hypothetical protein